MVMCGCFRSLEQTSGVPVLAVLRSKALLELDYLSMDLRFKIVSVEVEPFVMCRDHH